MLWMDRKQPTPRSWGLSFPTVLRACIKNLGKAQRFAFPLAQDPDFYLFEFACHEGNYWSMRSMLCGARLADHRVRFDAEPDADDREPRIAAAARPSPAGH